MKAQEGGGLEDDGGAQEPTRAQELCTEPKEHTVHGAEIRGAAARAAQDEELLFQQNVLSHEGLGSSGPEEFAQSAQEVKEDEEVVLHRRSLRSVVMLGKPAGK